MAEVARNIQHGPDIDYHLDYLFRQWTSIPEYASWWPEMDPSAREVFDLEWHGITESRLSQLQQWAEQGLLAPAQRARYETLLALIERQRPLLERLFGEPVKPE